MKIYKGISYAKNARTTMRRNVAARIISVRSSVTSREEDRPCSLSVSGPRCWSYSEDGAGLSLSSSTGTHLEWSSVHSGLYRGESSATVRAQYRYQLLHTVDEQNSSIKSAKA